MAISARSSDTGTALAASKQYECRCLTNSHLPSHGLFHNELVDLAGQPSHYGAQPRLFSALGRVNLIGEHTDYNHGFVLPMAIDRRTYFAISRREDTRASEIASAESRNGIRHQQSGSLTEEKWANYPAGMAWTLRKHGLDLCGADIVIDQTFRSAAVSRRLRCQWQPNIRALDLTNSSLTRLHTIMFFGR